MTYNEFQSGKFTFYVSMRNIKTDEEYGFYLNANNEEEANKKYTAPPWAKDLAFHFIGLNPNYKEG